MTLAEEREEAGNNARACPILFDHQITLTHRRTLTLLNLQTKSFSLSPPF